MSVIHPSLQPLCVDIDSVHPHPANPNRGDVAAIVTSIEVNGYYAPVVVQSSTGNILAGEHRWHALKSIGSPDIPVVYLDVDDEVAMRVMLVDNRTTRLGHDDTAALVALLEQLGGDDDSLLGTAYTPADLDALVALLHRDEGDDDADDDVNDSMEKATWPSIRIPPILLARLRDLPGDTDADKVAAAVDAWYDHPAR